MRFARIANHAAMTDWVPLLKAVQVSHPEPLPPGQSMAGTARVLALRGGVIIREEVVYGDPPGCYAYTTEGKRWPMRKRHRGATRAQRAAVTAPTDFG